MTDLARKDLFVCLGTWLAFEVVCFAFLTVLQLSQDQTLSKVWLAMSFPLGIGGAFLIAGSTQLSGNIPTRRSRFQKALSQVVVALLSWAGLVGIAFPIFIISVQVLTKLAALLNS